MKICGEGNKSFETLEMRGVNSERHRPDSYRNFESTNVQISVRALRLEQFICSIR